MRGEFPKVGPTCYASIRRFSGSAGKLRGLGFGTKVRNAEVHFVEMQKDDVGTSKPLVSPPDFLRAYQNHSYFLLVNVADVD
jgi:hypothetical protein